MAGKAAGEMNPTPRPLRLLIAEDSSADAELLVATLKQAGLVFSFEVADTLEGFEERLARGGYDLILSDYNLGAWNGLDALRAVKQSQEDAPIVIVTGSLGDEAAVECIKQGAADYVLKDRLVCLPIVVDRVLQEKARRDEHKLAEEAIRAAKEEWEMTFDAVRDPIVVLDEHCLIRRANRAVASLTGLDFSRVIGRRCHEVLHGSSEPPPDCPHQKLLETGAESQGDFHEPRWNKFFASSTAPLHDRTGALRGCVHVLRDITKRKQLEGQLAQSQKMEAVGRLAGGIAHDFNNLLTVINGYSQLMLLRLASDDPMREAATEILHAGERAAALTRQVLAFSRRQVLVPQVIDLNAVVSGIEKMLRRLIGEDIDLDTGLAEDLGRVKADPGQLEQVIVNLAVNARDAMPQGGRLTIETANASLDGAYSLSHPGVTPGPYVLLAVSDSGLGMDAETQSHIFEPFFTTKENGKGTGLGLSTVYGIVKQTGGDIWVYSEPRRGTTFKIYFPRVAMEDEAPVKTESAVKPGASFETILLVEDEAGVSSLVRTLLEAQGYRVLDGGQGLRAISMSDAHQGPIHLLLTDVVMPQISGPELAERLKVRYPEMKVLFMSGHTENGIVHHGVLEPGVAFIQKPFTSLALLRKVRETLDGTKMKNEAAA